MKESQAEQLVVHGCAVTPYGREEWAVKAITFTG